MDMADEPVEPDYDGDGALPGPLLGDGIDEGELED